MKNKWKDFRKVFCTLLSLYFLALEGYYFPLFSTTQTEKGDNRYGFKYFAQYIFIYPSVLPAERNWLNDATNVTVRVCLMRSLGACLIHMDNLLDVSTSFVLVMVLAKHSHRLWPTNTSHCSARSKRLKLNRGLFSATCECLPILPQEKKINSFKFWREQGSSRLSWGLLGDLCSAVPGRI